MAGREARKLNSARDILKVKAQPACPIGAQTIAEIHHEERLLICTAEQNGVGGKSLKIYAGDRPGIST